MRLQTSHNPLLSALSRGKESTFLGGSGWDSRQACPPTWDQALDYLASQQSQILSEDWESGQESQRLIFQGLSAAFSRSPQRPWHIELTVPVPGGGAEGKDRNWPRGIWTQ